jgi:hypothetical protein
VSGYLTRLVTRARESDKRQLLRPFVRSSSPIAEHDQRIGMADSEDFELAGAAPDPTGSKGAVGPFADFQTQSRPGITSVSDMRGTTIQRKRAAPPAGLTGPHAADSQITPDMHVSPMQMQDVETLSSPGTMEVKRHDGWLGAKADVGNAGEIDRSAAFKPTGPHPSTPLEPSSISWKASMEGDEPSVSSAAPSRLDSPGPDSLVTQDTHRRVIVDTRSARPARGVDSPRLVPAAHPFAERFEPSPSDAAASAVGPRESPRVVIGRINVEVVTPPAAKQLTSAPRPGPLTAASVSVIGPIGGGVRPNLRLSLRYR